MTTANTATGEKHLELTVSNFGPIAEGTVELRPFTVFVGPSNTGKSYLATLIYALQRFLNDYAAMRDGRPTLWRDHRGTAPLASRSLDLSENDIACLYDWANKPLPSQEGGRQQEISSYELPYGISALVRLIIDNQHHGRVLDDEITRCFGVNETASLARYADSGSAKFSLYSKMTSGLQHDTSFTYEINPTVPEANIIVSIPGDVPFLIDQETHNTAHRLSLVPGDNVRKDIAYIILAYAAGDAVSNIVGPLSHPVHYLPADRAGVMHAHQVAVRGLIASASRVALRQDSPMPVLSGVLGDFLEQLVSLASDLWYQGHGIHDDLAVWLEQRLLGGAVRVERSQIQYPAFVYHPDGWERDLPLMNTSSMVSELAPVVLYLRHIVQPGDTLIIEEPESHLHPAMQVEFTRLLAAAVKAGVRIIITTHSEWILEELANLLLMSELPEDQRHGFEGSDLALSDAELGVWLFEPDDEVSGTVVKEIPFDKEMGNFPSEFGLITTDLYNRFARISNRIERLAEEQKHTEEQ